MPTYRTTRTAMAEALAALTRRQCASGRHASYCEHRQGPSSPVVAR